MVAIQENIKDFIHSNLDEEIRLPAGHYVLTDEKRLPFQGREILYCVGYGVLEYSCCGNMTLYYALVPGFIVDWKYGKHADGRPVTSVEPILDEALQKKIRDILTEKESVSQCNFC